MSLETPDKIRSLQRKLYCKAKAEPAFRFYILYDKICREDILLRAYTLARANAGAPGVDGMTFGQIEAASVDAWLAGLREELVSKIYRPDPVRRVMIPKPGGGERPLGIPTIRDRVVQAAAKIVLEPIFEADFVCRWRIETTFREVREHLGVETQRQWSDLAILRTTPALLGLYSLVTVWAPGLMQTPSTGVRPHA